jgi:hypothetical protein
MKLAQLTVVASESADLAYYAGDLTVLLNHPSGKVELTSWSTWLPDS